MIISVKENSVIKESISTISLIEHSKSITLNRNGYDNSSP